jgi:hypothetical protein
MDYYLMDLCNVENNSVCACFGSVYKYVFIKWVRNCTDYMLSEVVNHHRVK